MLIIGIDPGISGSICFFKDGRILEVIEMPVMTEGKKNKKQVNGAQIYNEFLKRINNKKDVSSLIPGHGGLLDRLDGFLFAILYFYTLSLF